MHAGTVSPVRAPAGGAADQLAERHHDPAVLLATTSRSEQELQVPEQQHAGLHAVGPSKHRGQLCLTRRRRVRTHTRTVHLQHTHTHTLLTTGPDRVARTWERRAVAPSAGGGSACDSPRTPPSLSHFLQDHEGGRCSRPESCRQPTNTDHIKRITPLLSLLQSGHTYLRRRCGRMTPLRRSTVWLRPGGEGPVHGDVPSTEEQGTALLVGAS